MNVSKHDLSYLGLEYQERLLSQILSDIDFSKNILPILKPNYFSNDHLKILSQTIINVYDERGIVLDYGSLEIEIRDKFTTNRDEINDGLIQYIEKIKQTSKNDWETIQNRAIKFCKVQELAKIATEMTKEVGKGNIDEVLNFESEISKIMSIGSKNKNEITSFDNIDELLLDDFRHPIPTGIEELDKDMNGGLSAGELAIVLAPLGVGKTTMSTILANTAFNQGKNVLQICFEDSTKEIQRKHMARWTGIPINELSNRRNEVKELVKNKTTGKTNKLVVVKMSSIDTTMRTIRNYVKDLKQQGITIDLIIIDYIDCVQPSRNFTDQNIAEGMIMREFENLLSEFEMAGYAMTQGNRSSLSAEVVGTDQMGGSIKKAQIGHCIISIARTIEQKKENKATLAILKSRFGRDGIIYDNVIFNNGTLQVEILPNKDGTEAIFTQNNTKQRNVTSEPSSEIFERVLGEISDYRGTNNNNNF